MYVSPGGITDWGTERGSLDNDGVLQHTPHSEGTSTSCTRQRASVRFRPNAACDDGELVTHRAGSTDPGTMECAPRFNVLCFGQQKRFGVAVTLSSHPGPLRTAALQWYDPLSEHRAWTNPRRFQPYFRSERRSPLDIPYTVAMDGLHHVRPEDVVASNLPTVSDEALYDLGLWSTALSVSVVVVVTDRPPADVAPVLLHSARYGIQTIVCVASRQRLQYEQAIQGLCAQQSPVTPSVVLHIRPSATPRDQWTACALLAARTLGAKQALVVCDGVCIDTLHMRGQPMSLFDVLLLARAKVREKTDVCTVGGGITLFGVDAALQTTPTADPVPIPGVGVDFDRPPTAYWDGVVDTTLDRGSLVVRVGAGGVLPIGPTGEPCCTGYPVDSWSCPYGRKHDQ